MGNRQIAIEARRLAKAFGAKVVFSGVDLEVAEGQSVALCGANGAGKTTLLRCLASLARPSEGEVRWFGRPAATSSRSSSCSCSRSPADRRLIGMLAHESFLYPHLTVRDNLLFAARMCGVCHPSRQADRWLCELGLEAYEHRLPTRISRGMRQKLALARALVHQPRILLLDEPFSGLDAAGSEWLAGMLADLVGRGRTICFATHDQAMVARLAQRVLHLQSGRIEQQEAACLARSDPIHRVRHGRAA